MKKNYIVEGFRTTVSEMFPDRAEELTEKFLKRIDALREENANASEDKKFHLESQIMPGIAAYETLSTVMPKEKALDVIHGYVEGKAHRFHATLVKLLRVPGLYRAVPWMFTIGTRKMFGESAGFAAEEIKTNGGVWRIDMTKCPYHDTCAEYGCPELCHCFCDSDDVTYDGMHKKLVWRRTKTLGRGNDCCDFCLMIRKDEK